MDWSYELLSVPEAALFRRLSAFKGGFSLEAVESVCADEPVGSSEILDLLQHLIDKSMVVSENLGGAVRYRLLETVREYGHERLDKVDELPPLERNHVEYFLAFTEEAEPNLQGSGQGSGQADWLDRLEADHDNLRTALECAMVQKDGSIAGWHVPAPSAPPHAATKRWFPTWSPGASSREEAGVRPAFR